MVRKMTLPTKANDLVIYNAILMIYKSARGFAADVFTAQRARATIIRTRREDVALTAKLKMLNRLYDEQEEKQMMEKLAKTAAACAAALEQKAWFAALICGRQSCAVKQQGERIGSERREGPQRGCSSAAGGHYSSRYE